MATSEPRRLGVSIELKPHAYDPVANPELFEGVVSRRVVAFLIDFLILSIPVVFVSMFIFVIGIVTFGLGFLFYGLLWPAMVIWALAYYGLTLGSPASATIGMRTMDIEMRTWYGSPAYFVLGSVHAVVFWVTVSMLTPFVPWSACSTSAGAACTTCWWAPSSSTMRRVRRRSMQRAGP